MIEQPKIGRREEQTFSIYFTCPLDGNQLNCIVPNRFEVIHIESFDYSCTFTSHKTRVLRGRLVATSKLGIQRVIELSRSVI